MAKITLEQVKADVEVKAYIQKADEHMEAIGYTEHGFRHADLTAALAREVLTRLGFDPRKAELASIAGYLHDIGNVVNREDHIEASAIIAFEVLRSLGMEPMEVATVVGAIGNHEENMGIPINAVSAAVILADKADVHRSRVRNPNMITFDIHDRVNYAVVSSSLKVDPKAKTITLELVIDSAISSVMEYFEIFLSRMVISRRAAEMLGCSFSLVVNGSRLV